MRKGVSIILVILLILLIGGGLIGLRFILGSDEDTWICENGEWIMHGRPNSPQPQTPCTDSDSLTKTDQEAPTLGKESNQGVSLPTEEDIIRTFFAVINEQRPTDAISMMDPDLVGDESSKQSWEVHFSSMKSISVNTIEPSMKEEWTQNKHTYKIMLDVMMMHEAINAPIPNYGWADGTNIRWISISKISNTWKISQIATGP